MNRRLLDYAEAIGNATTPEAAWQRLMAQIEPLGFVYAKYGFAAIPDPDRAHIDTLYLGCYSPQWEEVYAKAGYARHDAIVQHCLVSDTPLTFAGVYERLDRGEFSARTAEVHAFGRDMGLRNGLVLPIGGQSGIGRGGLALVGSRDERENAFAARLARALDGLRAIARLTHEHLHRPVLVPENQHPSRRERECLLWSLRGLGTKQIAAKIGNHPKTVEKQLSSVRRRLGARTTTQAVLKAVMLGLLDP